MAIATDNDVLDTTTDEYQYRYLCLRVAHYAQESSGRGMDLDEIMERAERYWEFILGVDDDPKSRAAREKVAAARDRLEKRMSPP